MPTEAQFLAAITAKPDDDALRLVFADWLEEQGAADRGEFIKLQCELASYFELVNGVKHYHNVGSSAANTERLEQVACLEARVRELLYRHQQDGWLGAILDAMVAGDRLSEVVEWYRGFVRRLDVRWEDWVLHADVILAEQPIETVSLRTDPRLAIIPNPAGTHYRLVGDADRNRQANYLVRPGMGEIDHLRARTVLLRQRWPQIREWKLP